jgi:hypothetical protein
MEKAPPSFLDWSEDAITFSREDHPNHIPNPGQYPLVVDPVIGNARFSKVLMDGGRSLNILYAHTLRLLGIGWTSCGLARRRSMASRKASASRPLDRSTCRSGSARRTTSARRHLPLRRDNFRQRILGWSCYTKFMVVPNYTYLKMKMLGPKGVITVGSSIEHAFECDVECVEYAEALALDEALMASMEKLVNEDLDSTAKHADSFEAAEQTMEVPLDPATPEGKVLRVSSTLDPK